VKECGGGEGVRLEIVGEDWRAVIRGGRGEWYVVVRRWSVLKSSEGWVVVVLRGWH